MIRIDPPKRLSLWLALCAALLHFGGCGKGDGGSARLLPARSSTAKTSTQEISLSIDDVPVLFGAAELRAQATGNGVAVQFCTPGADSEKGNTFNFDFTLDDVDDPVKLAGAAWHYSNDDLERAETLNGITLKDGGVVLEPIEIHVLFAEGAEGKLAVNLEGQFRWFEPPDSEMALKIVTVHGKFEAPMPE